MSGDRRRGFVGERADRDLLRASVKDPEAFGMFYDRHFDAVLGFFCQRVSDPHQAADLTAETFAKALLGCHRFRYEDGNAVGWLMGIARHELSGTYRKQRNGKQALQRLGIGHISLDDDSLERIERLIDVESQIVGLRVALEELPKGLRAAVTLRVGHDLSFREVARQLGCSVPAARVRVSRGMSRLTEAVCA